MSDCAIEAEEMRGSEGVLDVPMPRTSACCGGPSANVGASCCISGTNCGGEDGS